MVKDWPFRGWYITASLGEPICYNKEFLNLSSFIISVCLSGQEFHSSAPVFLIAVDPFAPTSTPGIGCLPSLHTSFLRARGIFSVCLQMGKEQTWKIVGQFEWTGSYTHFYRYPIDNAVTLLHLIARKIWNIKLSNVWESKEMGLREAFSLHLNLKFYSWRTNTSWIEF